MIDHFNLPVSDLEKSARFYETVLKTLGYPVLFRDNDAIGFGAQSWEFGIAQEEGTLQNIHVAFRANNNKDVSAFYQAAIDAGAQCNGKPGYRSEYGPNYFAAFVIDANGHNVEAVCRTDDVAKPLA